MKDEFAGKDLVGLIEMLESVPEPVPVALWPATPGAYLALIFLAAALACGIYRLVRRYRANAYRRAALRQIAGAGSDVVRIAQVIRRAALIAYPRAEVAPLHGEAWLAFLDRSYGGTDFRNGAGRVVAAAPYRGGSGGNDLAELARQWIRRHRRPAP